MISGQLHNNILQTDFGWKVWKNSEAGVMPRKFEDVHPRVALQVCTSLYKEKYKMEQNANGLATVYSNQTS